MIKHTLCYKPGYPRPQLVRDSFFSLDGEWTYVTDDAEEGEDKGYPAGRFAGRTILVPFAPECPASGIGDESMHRAVWYRRAVSVGEAGNWLLNFEGSDYRTKVWINGAFAGENRGAYHRFTIPAGKFLRPGENTIVVRVSDDYDCERPRGKQRWQDGVFGCWYVQTTGIYKSVWLERAGESYLRSLKITPDLTSVSARLDFTVVGETAGLTLRCEVLYGGNPVARVETAVTEGENALLLPLTSTAAPFKYALWSPETPELYDVILTLRRAGETLDRVGSYFGLRSIRAEGGKILLNDVPVTMKLVLDQGYFGPSHLTPPDEAALLNDARLVKEMGFNGVRKHQKIEDERFLYYADVLGLFVWCEMPSFYRFTDASAAEGMREWGDIIRQNYSHPSVAVWVALNESWGVPTIATNPAQQNFSAAMYYFTKSFDPSRPVISNDGWEHTKSDLLTIHHYEQNHEKIASYYDDPAKAAEGYLKNRQKLPFAAGWAYEGQPVVFSEYGGAALDADTAAGWGYGSAVGSGDELTVRFALLTHALMAQPYCAGYCYTQLTDVQQEVNGLLTEDRTPKVDLEKIKEINDSY